MKYLVLLAIVILAVGCVSVTNVEETVVEEPEPEPEPVPVKEEVKVVEKTPEEICEDKATALIPKSIYLELANNHDPNSAPWTWTEEFMWVDKTEMDVKGDISFRKGRLEGENTKYWYTQNIQNEDLFGEGGLKYKKKITLKDGTVGHNEFIVKLILTPTTINLDPEPFKPYTGKFGIKEIKFVECGFVN